MAKIPQYIRQEPARVIPGVRVNPAAMTQDLQAMGQFGETLSDVGNFFTQKMREAREVTEKSNADVSLMKSHADLIRIAKTTDYDPENPDAITDFYKKNMDTASQGVFSKMKEAKAVTAAKRDYDKNSIAWNTAVWSLSNKKQIDHNKASLAVRTSDRVQNVDITNPEKTIQDGLLDIETQRHAGTITSVAAQKQKEKFIDSVNEQVVWTIANSLGFEEGMKFLNDPEKTEDISVSKLNSMKASLRTQWNTQNKIDDRQLKETQDKTSADYFTQLDKGTLTLDMVNRAVLAQTLSEADGRYYKKALEQETAGKTNPDTHLKLKDEILTANTEEKRIKAREKVLKAYGENKLFYKDAGTLLARIKEVDPIQNDRARRFHADLKQKNKDGVFESDVFLEKSNTLDAWLKANPDAKDKEVEDFFKALTKEEDNGWVAKILDAFWGVATFGAPNIEFPEKGGDDEAIRILIENKQPVTPANIKYIKDNM